MRIMLFVNKLWGVISSYWKCHKAKDILGLRAIMPRPLESSQPIVSRLHALIQVTYAEPQCAAGSVLKGMRRSEVFHMSGGNEFDRIF